MEIKIKSSTMLNMLRTISGGVYNNKKNNISSYILIKKINNKIFCASINNEIEIVTFILLNDYKENENGNFIVKYELIYNICKSNNENCMVTIKHMKNHIEIKTDNSIFNLPLLYNNEFPSFKTEKNEILILKLKSEEFKNLVLYPYTTISENNPKTFLNGILLDINKNYINTLSSDGFNLSYSNILYKNINEKLKIILPKIIIKEFFNIYKENEFIFIKISNNFIKIITNKTTLTSKLINDIYENTNIKISYDNYIKCFIKTNDIKKAITILNPICYNNNIINLDIKKNEILLKVKYKSEYGITKINSKTIGEEINISLNYKYITNILKIIKSEIIEMIITNMKNHLIIKEKNNDSIYLITLLKI